MDRFWEMDGMVGVMDLGRSTVLKGVNSFQQSVVGASATLAR